MNSELSTLISKESEILDILEKFAPLKYIGTPCGILKKFFKCIEERSEIIYSPSEDNSIALATGLTLGGETPVILMQNSGFAQSINVLASLIKPYNVPLLMIISLRGIEEDITPENVVMGKTTISFLNNLEIDYQILDEKDYIYNTKFAMDQVMNKGRSYALLVPPKFTGWKCTE